MARNRSNRGSGSARRDRDDAPQRSDGREQKPAEDRTAQTSAPGAAGSGAATGKPDPAAADPGATGRTPPAASPSGASSSSPGAPDPAATGTPSTPGVSNPAAPAGAKPAAAAGTATVRSATGALPDNRAVNAHAASTSVGGPSGGPPARPGATGPASSQRAQGGGQGGGPDRPGSGARPPTTGGASGRGGRGGRDFGIGLLGGVLGGGAVALLVLWSQGDNDELAALQGRLAQVESTVASTSDNSGMESLAERVQALESASGDELVARLEALEAGGSQADTAAADLSGRLAEIEAALAQLPGDEVAQLEQRLAALESAGASIGEADAGSAALQDAVTALQDRLEALSARLPEDTQDRLSQLDQRLGAAEQADSRLQQLADSVDQLTQKLESDEQLAQELANRVSALDERLSDAESTIEAAERNRNRAAALALIVGQLEAAIDESRSYETQIEALSAMTENGADDSAPGDDTIRQAVNDLEPGAASGVPSIAELRRSFVPVANDIVHAARAPDGDNLLNRATENLMRLVTVRPVGDDVRGETAEARVARAEAALDKGDLASAVAELDQLEGRPAEAAADWLSRAKARLGADQAVAQLRAQATDLLSKSD